MSEKSIIKCYLINGESNAQVEAEIDLNKPFNVNIIVVAKRIPDFRREFISPEDRFHYLESNALKREFLDTIEVGALVDDELVELDCNMTVANAWKKVLKGVPLEDGQEFAVLVNDYYRNKDDEMLVPVNEESGIVSQEMANKLIEENKALLEDKRSLQADKKLLLEEKKILTRERENLMDENRKLSSRIGEMSHINNDLSGQISDLSKRLDRIRTANIKLEKRPGKGKSVVNILAGVVVGLVLGALAFAFLTNTKLQANQSTGVETAEVSEENVRLKADYEALQKNYDELEGQLGEAQKAYDDMVKEKDAEIAKLQAKIDKYEGDGGTGTGAQGVELDDGAADSEAGEESGGSDGAEVSGAADGSEASGAAEGSGAAGGSESTGAFESSGAAGGSESTGAFGSGSEMKVDSPLIMDADKWVEIISEEDGSGKTVKYSAVSEYKDGVIVSFNQNSRSSFSLAVPEGYTVFSFDIGHIMDSGKFNIELKILVDGVVREDVGGKIKYTESPKHFDVTGLKTGQVITFDLDSDTFYSGESCKYGITNMVLHGAEMNGSTL